MAEDIELTTVGVSVEPVSVLCVSGAVDAEAALKVQERCESITAPLGAGALVVLELSGVTAATADGVRAMTAFVTGLARHGVQSAVVCPSGHVARVALDAALGTTSWPVCDSVDHALGTLTSASGSHAHPDVTAGESGALFVSLTEALLRAETVGDVLQRIVEATVVAVPAAELASITVRDPAGHMHTAASTDPVATELDDLQYRLGEGPCHDTAEPDGPEFVDCDDLRDGSPWPAWSPEAVKRGWRSVLATALMTPEGDGGLDGALNLYSREPGGLTGADRDVVLLLATHASLAIAETDAVRRGELRTVQFQAALDSRDVIGQAKGIIMARRRCDPDEAFELLRKTSQNLNVKLIDLATTLTRRHGEVDV